jgi:hypothetical protein
MALVGYNILVLRRAEAHAPSACEGWLQVAAEFPLSNEADFAYERAEVRGVVSAAPRTSESALKH